MVLAVLVLLVSLAVVQRRVTQSTVRHQRKLRDLTDALPAESLT